VRQSGADVVTQPGFIHWNGPSYRKDVSDELQPHLYPIGPLDAAGVNVAFGSDAPVINPNPWPAIYSAVTRKDREGEHFPKSGGQVGIRAEWTIRMHTLSGAQSEGTQTDKGSITTGKLADLILVDANPLTVDSEALKDIKAKMTIMGGKVVWEGR
jgi:predicted amidohydrolase YtcJ